MPDATVSAGGVRASASMPASVPAPAAAAPAKPLSRKLIFTLMMSGGMVTFMSLYNTALHTWFNFTVVDWLFSLILRWPFAFVLASTVADLIVTHISMPFAQKHVRPTSWVGRHLKPVLKVGTMVPFMTFIASVMSEGISLSVFPLWIFTYVTTLPVAIPTNIYVVSPIARRLYRAVFGEDF